MVKAEWERVFLRFHRSKRTGNKHGGMQSQKTSEWEVVQIGMVSNIFETSRNFQKSFRRLIETDQTVEHPSIRI